MSQSCLTDPFVPIVADTSAVINLNASGYAAAVLQALPNRLVLTDTVLAELRSDKRTGRDDARLIRSLINADLAAIAALVDLKEDHFAALVAGPAAETLDDGEAATIACALETSAVAIIDDRKAIALCARKHPGLVVASTVDLFAHDAVTTALGRSPLADAVYAALQIARMRVPSHHERWVVGLIGDARAKSCPSLRGALRAGRADAVPVGRNDRTRRTQ
jgi:predicted nucleic acid-binding protein